MMLNLTICKIAMGFNERTFDALTEYRSLGFKVIYMVNKSDVYDKYEKSDILILGTASRLSAPKARNYALQFVKTDRVLFLDDDANISYLSLNLLKNYCDNLLTPSCFMLDGKRKINFANKQLYNEKNILNFNKWYCEWSFVYDLRCLNRKERIFPAIGVGSRINIWSGEGLVSLLRIRENSEIWFIPVNIDHPSLNSAKDFCSVLKYQRGYGASYGILVRNVDNIILKIKLTIRFLAGVFLALLFRRIKPRTTSIFSIVGHLRLVYAQLWGFKKCVLR